MDNLGLAKVLGDARETAAADPLVQIEAPTFEDLDPATDLGKRPELVWLDKGWLHIDERYQRHATSEKSRRLIRKIAEEFSWAKFTPLRVAEIGDKFAVLDGQHSALAAMLVPAVVELPCWLVDAPDTRQQARVFTAINGDRLVVQPLAMFKAGLAAGDPDALQVDKVCREAGITVAYALTGAQGRLPPRHTQAVATIRSLIAAHGEGSVIGALQALAEAYPQRDGQLRGQIITALVAFGRQHGARIERARLVKVLAERDCEQLLDQARSFKELAGGSTQSALVMALTAAYDHGLAGARRLNPMEKAA